MRSLTTLIATGCLTALVIITAGCTGDSASTGPETSPPPDTVDTHAGHDHAHPSEGPHHGDLIELGNEEYHAELLHDDETGKVTIYVLDGAAKTQVPIDATEITINAKHDGTPEQFSLTAAPDTSDPAGKSSRFVSEDKELAAHLDEEGADPRLVLTINGKSYRGEITHSHDHDHDHAHGHE